MRHLIVAALLVLIAAPVHAVTLVVTHGTVQSSESVDRDAGFEFGGDGWQADGSAPTSALPFGPATNLDRPSRRWKANTLKTIRLNLAYVPSPYREETLNLPVSVGKQ
jgi:hypothetical protein